MHALIFLSKVSSLICWKGNNCTPISIFNGNIYISKSSSLREKTAELFLELLNEIHQIPGLESMVEDYSTRHKEALKEVNDDCNIIESPDDYIYDPQMKEKTKMVEEKHENNMLFFNFPAFSQVSPSTSFSITSASLGSSSTTAQGAAGVHDNLPKNPKSDLTNLPPVTSVNGSVTRDDVSEAIGDQHWVEYPTEGSYETTDDSDLLDLLTS